MKDRLLLRVTIAHLILLSLGALSVSAADRPNTATRNDMNMGRWLDTLVEPGNTASQVRSSNQQQTGNRSVRSQLVHGVLTHNPDTESGLSPYAIVNQQGEAIRYVEPVDGIDLENYLGRDIAVKRDLGKTLLATQLALPRLNSAPSGFQLVQHQEELPTGNLVENPNPLAVDLEPINLDDGLYFENYPPGASCGTGVYGCGAGVIGCGSGCCEVSPRFRFFADYLLLKPRSTEIGYAVPLNNGIPIGATDTVDVDYNSGFRFGLEMALTDCSWVSGSYAYYSGSDRSSISIDPAAGEVFSLVTHPATFDAAILGYGASASLGIDLEMADFEYRRMLFATSKNRGCGCGPCGNSCGPIRMNYVAGLRYASLDQEFRSFQTLTGGVIDPLDRQLNTNIEFSGVGPRVGFEFEAGSCRLPLFVYSRTYASFLAGEYKARYTQIDDGNLVEALNTWEKDRLAPILDLELGIGAYGPCGTCLQNMRFSAGYVASYWFNAITVDDFIKASQFLDYVDLGDTISFDGLQLRAELVF